MTKYKLIKYRLYTANNLKIPCKKNVDKRYTNWYIYEKYHINEKGGDRMDWASLIGNIQIQSIILLNEFDKKELYYVKKSIKEEIDEIGYNSFNKELLKEDLSYIKKISKDSLMAEILKEGYENISFDKYIRCCYTDEPINKDECMFYYAINSVIAESISNKAKKLFKNDNVLPIKNETQRIIDMLFPKNIRSIRNLFEEFFVIMGMIMDDNDEFPIKGYTQDEIDLFGNDFLYNYVYINEVIFKYHSNVMRSIKIEVEGFEEIIKKNERTIEKYKKIIKKYEVRKKEELQFEKMRENIDELKKELDAKNQIIEKLTKEIKDNKERPLKLYNSMIDSLNEQIANLKLINKERQIELKQIKKDFDKLIQNPTLEVVKKYIQNNGVNEEIISIISPYMKQECEIDAVEEEKQESIEEPQLAAVNKIGYCVIDGNKHYISFNYNDKLYELNGLPEGTYLSDNQFILVSPDNNFKWAYSYKYDNSYLSDMKIAIVKEFNLEDNYLIASYCDEKEEKIYLNNFSNPRFKLGQVIGINNSTIARLYKPISYNIDSFLSSIKAKQHDAYFILKNFNTGFFVRNIITDEEMLKSFELKDNTAIEEGNIVCTNDNRLVTIFKSSRFYTMSSMYNRSFIGILSTDNKNFFVTKANGEKVIINNVPSNIDSDVEGEIIKIDEFNNFIRFEKHDEAFNQIQVSDKKVEKKPKNNTIFTGALKAKTGVKVLILGNVSYENSYKLAFFKEGIDVEVIEGFDSWGKIASSIKESNYVIIVLNHVSHDNMWRIKRSTPEIPVIYSEYDGANRLVELIIQQNTRESV